MTIEQAIEIIDNNAVQLFPIRVTVTDFFEAKNMLLDIAREVCEEEKDD